MKKIFILFVFSFLVPVFVMGQNMLVNPGFEAGDQDADGVPDGWISFSQGKGTFLELVNEAGSANSGDYYVKVTSDTGRYHILYQQTYTANPGEVWELSAYIKDLSIENPGKDAARLKISARNSAGGNLRSWEVVQAGVTSEWKQFKNAQEMPAGTYGIQVSLVTHVADNAPVVTYAYDDVSLDLVYVKPDTSTAGNQLVNPGFEDGDADVDGVPDGWISFSQGAGTFLELVNNAGAANTGQYYVKVTSDTGRYHILYQQTVAANPGEIWELSAFMKDLTGTNPGRDAARLKVSARNASGGNLQSWEVVQEGVTSYWKQFSHVREMPVGTYGIQVSIVTHVADNEPAVTYAYDDVKLELIYKKPPISNEKNILANPGFEDGDTDSDGVPDGWISFSQGAGTFLELINDAASANSGQYYTKVTSDVGRYHILYQQSYPANPGEVWELSAFMKDLTEINPGRDEARLKISARNSAGGNLKSWEIVQKGVTSYWKQFSYVQEMPEGTYGIQVSIVTHVADEQPAVTYAYDDVKLEMVYKKPPKSGEFNMLANPGFEEGDTDANGIPDGWIGYAQTGASMELINDAATACSGNYWAKCTSTNGGYYLLYQKTFPANPGEVWKFTSFIKDVSPAFPGASYAALKISAKNSSGTTFQAWEVFQDSVTTYWRDFKNVQTMPEGTSFIQAVVVIHGADGAPEASYGIDDVSLELVQELKVNSGFEDGDSNGDGIPDGWLGGGTSGITHMETINDSTAHSGKYWAKLFVDQGNGYYLCYLDPFPAEPGNIFSLRAFIKNTCADSLGEFAYLKMTAKTASGSNISIWEDRQLGVSRQWKDFSITHTMPVGTVKMQPSLLVKKSAIDSMDASYAVSYGFDDVRIVKLGTADITAPAAPADLAAADGEPYTNLVTWTDAVNEAGEIYTLYASESPIKELNDPAVKLLADAIPRGTQRFVHYLRNPYEDKEATFYYALTVTDTAANVSAPGFSEPHSNMAFGVVPISRIVPEDFAADGDVAEWERIGVVPLKMKPSTNHTGVGKFTDDDDVSLTGYIGIDDENLCVSFDVTDNVYSYDASATYYKNDIVMLSIGLYNQVRKHMSTQRGEEPDYRFSFMSTYLRNIFAGSGSDELYQNGSNNYNFTVKGNNYVIEAKIPLDALQVGAQESDTRFHPEVGMTIALDIELCDSDVKGVRDGLLTLSPENNDDSWKGPQYWTYTWIDDSVNVAGVDNKAPIVYTYELKQNYPNPFNPSTSITYSLAEDSKVDITIFDILGKQVAKLVDARQKAGLYTISYNASNLATGIYFYQIKADKFSDIKKMLLVK